MYIYNIFRPHDRMLAQRQTSHDVPEFGYRQEEKNESPRLRTRYKIWIPVWVGCGVLPRLWIRHGSRFSLFCFCWLLPTNVNDWYRYKGSSHSSYVLKTEQTMRRTQLKQQTVFLMDCIHCDDEIVCTVEMPFDKVLAMFPKNGAVSVFAAR